MSRRRGCAVALLALAVGAACLGAGCTGTAAAGATSSTRPDAAIDRLESEVRRLVNRHRTAAGLPTLASDAGIARVARGHSAAMASGARPFGHEGFAERMAAIQRARPCPSGAENVSSTLGYDEPAPAMLRGWLESRGHRRTIESTWAVTGVGAARSRNGKLYVTQIFCAAPD